jgi:GGDEF domain-containing protein
MTSRVSQEIRDSDTFSRFGGDEFVVVLPGIGETERAEIGSSISKPKTTERFVAFMRIRHGFSWA